MKKSSPSKSVRGRFHLNAFASRPVLAVTSLLVFAVICAFLARAALPPSTTFGPNSAPVSWVGTAPGGASAGEASCVDGVNCDTFQITVTGTPADWASKLIALTFNWTVPTTDYDFYIRKDSVTGPVVGTGRNDGAPALDDNAAIDPAATGVGDYIVHIVYFSASAADQYRGTATAANKSTAERAASYLSSGITFGPNRAVKAPVSARDGEPSIRTDYKGNSYTGGIRGVPAGVDLWYYDLNPTSSTFDPFLRVPAYRGQPDGTGEKTPADAGGDGGGDIDLAVGFPPLSPADTEPPVPFMAYSSLTLANISTGLSRDRGATFELNPTGNLTGGPPGDDRQWHEFLGANSVYLLYRTVAPAIAQVQRSNDGGFTYGPAASAGLIGQVGCLDVHQATGTVYAAGNNGVIAVGQPSVAGQAPTTADYTIRQAATDPNGVAHIFFVAKVADDGTANGTLYALYSNASRIYLKHSLDKGGSWSSPVRVDPPTGPFATNVNLFPWMETGPTPGSVGIVWYGTTNPENNDSAEWKVYFAQSFDAHTATPTFRIAEVTEPEHVIHGSNISEMGLNPTAGTNRNLIDYFQVSFDPLGAAVIAYTDDHNDFDGNTYNARQITGPSIKGGNLPAAVEGSQLFLPAGSATIEEEDVFPPRQPGLNGEQVTDFELDVQSALVTRVRTPDPLDLASVRYGTSGTGSSLAIAASMRTTDLPAIPAGSFWRASFAVNAPHSVLNPDGSYSFGVADDGDQFYLQADNDENGLQVFTYGTAVRNPDGSITYTKMGDADAGAFNLAHKTISVQVSVAKLNAVLAAAGRPLIANGTVVAGLRARAVTVDIVAPPPAGRQGRRDLTRGGTQFVVHDSAFPAPAAPPAPTPEPPRFLAPGATPVPTPPRRRLANIATRVDVQGGQNDGIAGFIKRKAAPKRVLIRAQGPSITSGGTPVAGTLQDPVLKVFDATGEIATNDSWRSAQQAEITATGLAPANDKEPAIILNLTGANNISNYTAILSGVGGATGIGLVEVYDLDAESFADLGNVATRGLVGSGNNVLIGGFIVLDDSFTNQPQNILVRGIGPSLSAAGVSNALQDPSIALHDAQGALIVSNNDWGSSPEAAALALSGLAPPHPKESAILRTLAPGAYTVVLSGVNGGIGVGSVEAYNLGNQ